MSSNFRSNSTVDCRLQECSNSSAVIVLYGRESAEECKKWRIKFVVTRECRKACACVSSRQRRPAPLQHFNPVDLNKYTEYFYLRSRVCFLHYICRPSDSTESEDAGIEPRDSQSCSTLYKLHLIHFRPS